MPILGLLNFFFFSFFFFNNLPPLEMRSSIFKFFERTYETFTEMLRIHNYLSMLDIKSTLYRSYYEPLIDTCPAIN